MSKIEQLIKEKCPNGVEYKQIKDVFTLFSGMRGVSSKWADNGNCRFIDYMNAYNNNKIDVTKLPFATVKNLNQNTLQQGDILLTSASEIPDECAISSVIEDNINDGVFMDDHLFGLRINDEYVNIVNTTFINYYLSSTAFRENLYKAVRGVTRFYISNNDFVKLKIPIPPIEVQEEIVKILDKFNELETELETELEIRKKQYEFCRDKLYTFTKDVKYISIEQVCNFAVGGDVPQNAFSKVKTSSFSVPIYSNGIENKALYGYTNKAKIDQKCVTVSARGTIGYSAIREEPFYPIVRLICVIPKDNLNVRFLKYYFDTLNFKVPTTGIPQLTVPMLKRYKIPFLSLKEQERIVKILDKFDKLINDVLEGIPAEIETRRIQYEYYRNKLLNFEELKDEKSAM